MKTFVVLVHVDRTHDYFIVKAEALESEEFRAQFFKELCRWGDGYGGDWLRGLKHDEIDEIEHGSYPLFSVYEIAERLPIPGLLADLKRRSDEHNKEIQGKLKEQEERNQRDLYERLKQKFGG